MTPRMTDHARQRCAEMGISTKIAKRIVQTASLTRPGNNGSGRRVAVSDQHPDYAVVFFECDNGVIVASVLYRHPDVTGRPPSASV